MCNRVTAALAVPQPKKVYAAQLSKKRKRAQVLSLLTPAPKGTQRCLQDRDYFFTDQKNRVLELLGTFHVAVCCGEGGIQPLTTLTHARAG